MPFYEYQCKNCGHELEAMQKVSDSPLKKCPQCGKSQLQRLMSAPVFRLKGGGWYETDFKDDKDKKRNLADGPEADSSKESDVKPADSKDKAAEPAKAESAKPEATKADSTSDSSKPKVTTDQPTKSAAKSPRKKANVIRKKSAKAPARAARRNR